MSKNALKELALVKIQPTPATDPVPTVAEAMLVQNITVAPLVADAKNRTYAKPLFGTDAQVLAQQRRTVSFDFDMAGSGAAGTPPVWGAIMRACSHAETITVGTKVEYAPLTGGVEAITVYHLFDGILHKLTDAKGTLTATLQGGDLPMFHTELTGFFSPVGAMAFPDGWDAVLDAQLSSIESNEVNTAFTIHAYAAVLEQLTFTQGNTVEFSRRANRMGVDITNRAPTGQVSFETVAAATFDPVARASASTLGAVQAIQGTVAGNIVQFDAPAAQMLVPSYTKRGNTSLTQCGLAFNRGAGDDDYKWTVK